ncbi:M48 family metallopeptidase [Naumannella sp. ID2617S]|nr:M48 family metallopeptidase [Naumannella sp. ID2617S]
MESVPLQARGVPVDGGLTVAGEPVEVRRSARRRRTVSAYREDGRIVVLLPARMSRAEEARWVSEMVQKVRAREARVRGPRQPSELLTRALELQQRYLAPQLEVTRPPQSVTWVGNQNSRWGSCTPDVATIRLSDRLQSMPGWVVDYVLLHELTHLAERDHTSRFWRLLDAYPRTQEAKGYLAGWVDGRAASRD